MPRVPAIPPPDDAFLVIKGRKWRRSDPHIPPALRQELVDELMAARRSVGAAEDERERRVARGRVHDAKVALGERGTAWWLDQSAADVARRVDAAIRVLLRSRGPRGRITPGEPARIVDGRAWRRHLPLVRQRAVELAQAGDIVIVRDGRPASGDLTTGTLRYRWRRSRP